VHTPSQVYILLTGYRPVGSPFFRRQSAQLLAHCSLALPNDLPFGETNLPFRVTIRREGHTLGVLNARIEFGYSIRSAMTVAGRIVGQACSNSRIRGSRASTTGPVECPSTLARPAANAILTLFFKQPILAVPR
jgi:hypothetical protein